MYAHDVPIYTNDEVDIPRGDDVDSCNDPVTDWNRRERHEINVEAYERVAAGSVGRRRGEGIFARFVILL